MRILTIGDICSPLGVAALLKVLPKLKAEFCADAVIVNGENSNETNGISKSSAEDIFAAGADVITGGNHTLRIKEIHPLLDQNPFLLTPHNLKCDIGHGYCLLDLGRASIAVINLLGEAYIERCEVSNPFKAADELIERANADGAQYIIVDFHAEATGEKKAMGYYLDGRVTALFGTHTHIQTNDAQILEHGTGYITDIGMTGPENSVLGIKKEIIIARLKDGDQSKFQFAQGKCIVSGCLFEASPDGRCSNISSFIKHI